MCSNNNKIEVIQIGQKEFEIYHYTSVSSLKSIIKDKALRFTEGRFLNDKNEFNCLKDVINVLKDDEDYDIRLFAEQYAYIAEEKYDGTGIVLVPIDGAFSFSKYQLYVFSASLNPDSLPLWNYYSKEGRSWGYNIKINIDQILKIFSNFKKNSLIVYHGKVMYDMNEKIEFVKDRIREITKSFEVERQKIILKYKNDENTMLIELDVLVQEKESKIIELFELCRLVFKEKYFKHEEEYRIVLSVTNYYPSQLLKREYTEKNGLVRPHFDLLLNDLLFIDEIKISPLIDFNLAKESLQMYINTYCSEEDKSKNITKSLINIRF